VPTEQHNFNGPRTEVLPAEFDFGGVVSASPVFPRFLPHESTLAEILATLRKRKWIIVTAVLVALTFGVLISARTKPQYSATARIAISKESGENFGFKGSQSTGDSEDYDYTVSMDTQTNILQSNRIALEVIENLHLDENRAFAGDLAASKPKTGDIGIQRIDHAREAALLALFHSEMGVRSVRNTRILDVSFRSPDPALAAQIADGIVAMYIEDNYRTRYETTMQSSDWLAKQISDLKQRVETSQEKLVRYQRENGMLGIDEKQNIITQKLDDLNKSVTEAQADRISKQAAYETAKVGKFDEISEPNGLSANLRQQEASLRSQYAMVTTNFGPNYPKSLELKNQIDQTQRSIDAENQRQLTKLQSEFTAAQAREAMLAKALDQQKLEANQLNEKSIEFSILKRDLDANRTLYEGLLQKLKEAGVTAGLRSSNIRIVDNARVPISPVTPNWPRNLELSLLAGLIGGVLLTFLIEALDNTVRTPEEAQSLVGLPSLGLIPHSNALKTVGLPRSLKSVYPALANRSPSMLVAQSRPNSDIVESFRSLRTSLLLSSAVKRPNVILFTSPMPQEGKTTTCVNMAIVLAQRGGKILLVDTDLRRPSVHSIFGLPNVVGLSNVLADLEDIDGAIQQYHPIPNLFILTAGPTPPQPAELLGSDRMQQLLERFRTEYDQVILDSSPVNLVTDPAVLSPHTDAVLLVVRASMTSKSALRHARDQLHQINAPLKGVVVNDAKLHSFDYRYRSYYGTKDGSDQSEEPQEKAG
jgi:capsular exopolysaccharide synthesis family protein